MAILEDDTFSTYADTVTGNYMLRGLPQGSYMLEFQPEGEFRDTILTDVGVVNGQITVIDSITIH
jgi:hypothetical protein